MVTAGNPNNGVDVDGWSNEAGGGGCEAEVEVWFSDPSGIELKDFSVHWQDYELLPKQIYLIRWKSAAWCAVMGDFQSVW